MGKVGSFRTYSWGKLGHGPAWGKSGTLSWDKLGHGPAVSWDMVLG